MQITHANIVAYFEKLVTNLKGIESFFRMDLTEIQSSFRSSANFPCLVLESYEGDLQDSNTSNSVNQKTFAFTIYTNPKADDYNQQNLELSLSEELGLKIIGRMRHDAAQPDHLLFRKFKVENVSYAKVGPVFNERLYGYRFIGVFLENQSLKINPLDWEDLPSVC